MNSRIRELRKMLKLSQHDFAETIGIRGSSLSDIERGRCNVSNQIVIRHMCKI